MPRAEAPPMISPSRYAATYHNTGALALALKTILLAGYTAAAVPLRTVERRISARACDRLLSKRDPARRAFTSCDAEGCGARGRFERGRYRAVYGGAADDGAEFARWLKPSHRCLSTA